MNVREGQTPVQYHIELTDRFVWLDGISLIHKSEASLLANYTDPLPENPDIGLYSLDVFHVLHCVVSHCATVSPVLVLLTNLAIHRTHSGNPFGRNDIPKSPHSAIELSTAAHSIT